MITKPITVAQIAAANALWESVPSWVCSYSALNLLARQLPDHDNDSCFLKTVAINGIFNTFVFDLIGMARHVHKILSNPRKASGPELIDALAANGKMYRSFASKYGHFFVDRDKFPILDQYVLKSLAHHRGERKVSPSSYKEFHTSFLQLHEVCEISYGNKEIDQYLWISGMYRHWLKKGNAELGRDACGLFSSSSPRIVELLQILL